MELKPGYKQTEVGEIPTEWSVGTLLSVLASPIQNGVFYEPTRKGRGCKLLNVGDLYGRFPVDTKELELFDASGNELQRFGLKEGDIFFTRSSLTPDGIAWCNVFGDASDEPIVFDCHIIRARPESSKVDAFYLARYCGSSPARRYLVTHAKTTTMTTIDQSVISNLPVPLPPIAEQRAIAAALSDVDALLAKLDQLIAKKRDLKQAAMQQLLTGQTRLPGFEGEWEVTTLGMKASFRTGPFGSALHQSDYTDDGVPIVNPMHIVDGQIRPTKGMTITEQVAKDLNEFRLRVGDIVIGRRGEMGRCAVVGPRHAGWLCGTGSMIVRSNDSNPEFLQVVLSGDEAISQIEDASVGTTMVNLNQRSLSSLVLKLPSLSEQSAIANVLSDMDAELATLEARRDKTRQLKQGMMQELLTGRIRLV